MPTVKANNIHDRTMNYLNTVARANNSWLKRTPRLIGMNLLAIGTGTSAAFTQLLKITVAQPAGMVAKGSLGVARVATWSHLGETAYNKLPDPLDWLKSMQKLAMFSVTALFSLIAAVGSIVSSKPAQLNADFQAQRGLYTKNTLLTVTPTLLSDKELNRAGEIERIVQDKLKGKEVEVQRQLAAANAAKQEAENKLADAQKLVVAKEAAAKHATDDAAAKVAAVNAKEAAAAAQEAAAQRATADAQRATDAAAAKEAAARQATADAAIKEADAQRATADAQRATNAAATKEADAQRAIADAQRATDAAATKEADAQRATNAAATKEADAQRAIADAQRATDAAATKEADAQRAIADAQRATNAAATKEADAQRAIADAQRATNAAATKEADAQRAIADAQRATADAQRATNAAATKEADAQRATANAQRATDAAQLATDAAAAKEAAARQATADAQRATNAAATKEADAQRAIADAQQAKAVAQRATDAAATKETAAQRAIDAAKLATDAATAKETAAQRATADAAAKEAAAKLATDAATAKEAIATRAINIATLKETAAEKAEQTAQATHQAAQDALKEAQAREAKAIELETESLLREARIKELLDKVEANLPSKRALDASLSSSSSGFVKVEGNDKLVELNVAKIDEIDFVLPEIPVNRELFYHKYEHQLRREVIKKLIDEGRKELALFSTNELDDALIKNLNSLPRDILETKMASIIWFLMYQSSQKGEDFEEGIFLIPDPENKIAKILRGLSSICYPRISSHLKGQDTGIHDEQGEKTKQTHMGIDIDVAHLPYKKGHILIIPVNDPDTDSQLLYLKPETAGLVGLTATAVHTYEYFFSLGRKLLPSWFGSDDQPGYKKERVPQDILQEFKGVLGGVPLEAEMSGQIWKGAQIYGIKLMYRFVHERADSNPKCKEFADKLLGIYGFNVNFVTGNEAWLSDPLAASVNPSSAPQISAPPRPSAPPPSNMLAPSIQLVQ